MTKRIVAGVLSAAVIFASLPVAAEEAGAPVKTIGQPSGHSGKMIPSLAVLNSGGATLVGNKLTMTDVAPTSIIFSDRPYRSAGHVLTKDFISEWAGGKDSFAVDPPNATISVLAPDRQDVVDAVVVLKKPVLEGNKLTFEVSVLEGDLKGANGPSSLFIDWFAARGYGGRGVAVGGFHGGYGAVGYRGGFYAHPAYGVGYGAAAIGGAALGAAAVGAAAAAPYYAAPAACGYYPYPPCY
jgi:hypothetical protein